MRCLSGWSSARCSCYRSNGFADWRACSGRTSGPASRAPERQLDQVQGIVSWMSPPRADQSERMFEICYSAIILRAALAFKKLVGVGTLWRAEARGTEDKMHEVRAPLPTLQFDHNSGGNPATAPTGP